ncbi:MAG: hypothetical protein AAGI52_01305 [Bacteroidota bacterium]
MRFALILIVIVALGGILFATQPTNLEEIEFAVPFIGTSIFGIKLWTVLGAWILGLALGYLAAVPGAFSAKRRAKKAEKQLAAVGGKTTEAAPAPTTTAPPASAAASDAATDSAEIQRLADQVAKSTEGLR